MTEASTTTWCTPFRSDSSTVALRVVVEPRLILSGGVSVIILPVLVILLGLVLLVSLGG